MLILLPLEYEYYRNGLQTSLQEYNLETNILIKEDNYEYEYDAWGKVLSVARSAKKIVQSVVKREDLKTAVESTIKGAVNGFTDGFMSGGIINGLSLGAVLYPNVGGLLMGKTEKLNYGRVTLFYNSNNGVSVFNIADAEGSSKFRMEMDYENLFHTHFKIKKHGNSFHRTKQTSIIFGLLIGLIGD